MQRTKPDLKVGEEYRIILYPFNGVFNGNYLGGDNIKHIFRGSSNGVQGVAIVSNHWMSRLSDGTITYPPICSSPILFVPECNIEATKKAMPTLQKILDEDLEEGIV